MKKARNPPVSTRRNASAPQASGAPISPSVSTLASKQVTPRSTDVKGKWKRKDSDSQKDVLKKGMSDFPQGDSQNSGQASAVVESQVGSTPIGRLSADFYKPFGPCARTSSDTGNDTDLALCKRGQEREAAVSQ